MNLSSRLCKMSLQLEERVVKHQPFSVYLEDALKTLNCDHTPRTIPRRYYKQRHTQNTSELGQKSPNRGKGHKNLGSKLPPDKSMVATKGPQLSPDGGIVGLNAISDKGMVGTKAIKGGLTRVEKEKQIVSERMKTGKDFSLKKSSKMTHVQPLGKLREYKTDYGIDHIPSLRKIDGLDAQYEKEKHIQKILNSLNLNTSAHYRNPTSTSSKKQPVIKNTTGIDFASSLMESHNLTLKQLREFWQDMPSFLNIQAAKLRRKYGIIESEAPDDIDDISIEIVTKWNKPTMVLPDIQNQTSRTLYVVEEES